MTGDCVRSKPYTHIPDADWNRIFKHDIKDSDPADENSRNNKQPHLSGRRPLPDGDGPTSDRTLARAQDD